MPLGLTVKLLSLEVCYTRVVRKRLRFALVGAANEEAGVDEGKINDPLLSSELIISLLGSIFFRKKFENIRRNIISSCFFGSGVSFVISLLWRKKWKCFFLSWKM